MKIESKTARQRAMESRAKRAKDLVRKAPAMRKRIHYDAEKDHRDWKECEKWLSSMEGSSE